jgi:hypothetical protein
MYRTRWVVVIATGLALSGSTLLLTCGGGEPAPPADKDPVVLRAAGLEVKRSEIAALEGYVQRLDPTIGEMTRKRAILDHYLLPLKLARRDFPKERAQQRQRAEALARALGDAAGYDDLATQSKLYPGAGLEQHVARRAMSLPEARWAFADENVGRASPILETPRGYSILATLEKRAGPTMHYDSIDVWVTPFHTHANRRSYLDWLVRAKASLSGHLTFIHDDYKEALPYWLRQ